MTLPGAPVKRISGGRPFCKGIARSAAVGRDARRKFAGTVTTGKALPRVAHGHQIMAIIMG